MPPSTNIFVNYTDVLTYKYISFAWSEMPLPNFSLGKWELTTECVSFELKSRNEMCLVWRKISQDAFHIKWKYTTRYVSCDVKSYNKMSHMKWKYLMVVFRVKWGPTMRCVLYEKNIHMARKLLYSVSEIFPIAQEIAIVIL